MDRCDCFGQRQSDVAGRSSLDSVAGLKPLEVRVTSHRLCVASNRHSPLGAHLLSVQ